MKTKPSIQGDVARLFEEGSGRLNTTLKTATRNFGVVEDGVRVKRPRGRPRKDGNHSNNQPDQSQTPVGVSNEEKARLHAIVESSKAILPATFITSPEALYAMAKAQKEAAMAARAEMEYKILALEYVSRETVRDISAKIVSQMAQSLRAIADLAERRLGLEPEQSEFIESLINGVMETTAFEMKNIHEEAAKIEEERQNKRMKDIKK